MRKVVGAIACLAIAGFIMSCSYAHKDFPQAGSPLLGADNFVLQIDDFGAFWNADISAQTLATISDVSQRTNTVVVIFIHGWHHNAAPDDENVRDFAESLRNIRFKLQDDVYRSSRERLTGSGDLRVIGIYVGWRGKSLPMPLDYLTFWGRKAAAERVGEGDLREFLLRLNEIYRQHSQERETSPRMPFLGMISIGHSFGAQVLFGAVAGSLEEELISATKSALPEQRVHLRKPIEGFGDLTILINPALEAFQYGRIDRLSREIEFDSRQAPLLLVLSSATDTARKVFFPLGRTLGAIYRAPFRTGQREQWTEALGEYAPQRTHLVEIVGTGDRGTAAFDPSIYTNNPCGIVNFDLTNVPSIAGVQLKPTESHPSQFDPFIVAYASGSVVIHHSGIFEAALLEFLNDYVAIVEGKRMLLADPDLAKCFAPIGQ